MLVVEYAKDAQWADAGHNSINLTVKFDHMSEELPFHATPWDSMQHGKDIFEQAKNGEFGEVAEWTPPSNEELAAQVRYQRNELLAELDTLVNNPLRWASYTEDYKTALATYRQALLDVPEQSGFPTEVVWPNKP
jgi:hypothetical protein